MLFAVLVCVVLNRVRGLLLVPYVNLFLRVLVRRYAFVCSVYDVSRGVV